jgi:hypothetical protein
MLQPLLLEFNGKPFDETIFLKSKQVDLVKEDVTLFYRRLFTQNSSGVGRERWVVFQ